MRKFFRIIRNIILVILLCFLILFTLGKVYEKEIVNKAITALNKKIQTPISVDKITLNLWKHFPFVTIELHKVKVNSSSSINTKDFKDKNTVSFVDLEKVILSFNAKSLLDNTYELNKIILEKGSIHIFIDKNGKRNYVVFSSQKNKNSTTPKSSFHLLLNSLKIKEVNFFYTNAYKKEVLQIFADNFQIKGEFYEKKYTASTKGSLQLKKYSSPYFSFQPEHPTSVKTELKINNDTIFISKASLFTKGIRFGGSGTVLRKKTAFVDIQLKGEEVQIASLLRLLPSKKWIKNLDAKGILSINTNIKGEWSAKKTPKINSNYSIKNGFLSYKKENIELENLMIKGFFSNYSKPMLSLSKFSFVLQKSRFSGNASISDFKHPIFNLTNNFNINLPDLENFIAIKTLSLKQGNLAGKVKIGGKLKQKMTKNDWLNLDYKATMQLAHSHFQIKNPDLGIAELNAAIQINKEKISISHFSANCLNLPIFGNITVPKPMKIITEKNKNISVFSNLNIGGRLDFKELKNLFINSNKEKKSVIDITVFSKISIKELIYNKFLGRNISGELKYKANELKLNHINFYAFDGNIKSNVEIKSMDKGKLKIYSNTNTQKVSIKKVFEVFDNFHQNFILSTNLKGKLDVNLDGEIFFKDGKAQKESLNLLGHVKIKDGELIGFEPAKKLAAFSEIPELSYLKFATLENDIMISSNKITIPQMNIITNAMDINLFGNHQFNGDFEYHIKLLLSEMIGGKNKRLQRRQSEFGIIEDDGLGRTSVYLVAQGIKGDTKIKFDKKALSKHLKKEIREEKIELKKVLNKEFGWFKKDSLPEKKDTAPQKYFEIEWEDD